MTMLDYYLTIQDNILSKLPNIVFALIILISFWIAGKILKSMILKILQKKTSHTNILNVIGSIVKNIMLIIGIITSLGTLGVNVSGIVAGLGITGVALSLALKDILSNFISGILILMHEPFKLGDFVEIEGKSGKVIGINLRYVTIDAEGKNILVPNLISASKIVIIHKNHN